MYSYEDNTSTRSHANPDVGCAPRARMYRPDLVPVIGRWLRLVPANEWQHFVQFAVGQQGEFIAKFMKSPTRGGPLRLVTITVDHNYSEMRTDTGVWYEYRPVRLTSANLTLAVDTI